jgi:LPXTG-site transpeptidase (sortase) family protein
MKLPRLLTFAGAALLLAALILFLWQAAPTISSRLYTRSISTAPPMDSLRADGAPGGVPDAGEITLLPFEATPSFPTETPALTVSPTPTARSPEEGATAASLSPTPLATATATAILTPPPGAVPEMLHIPILDLDAPVVPIGLKTVTVNGVPARMWNVPAYRAAGWHDTSARLGLPGNTVLNGHNTASGEVFRDLYKVPIGALVVVDSQDGEEFAYRVKEKYILPEAGQPLEVRLQNALYVQKTQDERLTLVTCHPYGSLANRLIIIAVPAPLMPQRGE